MYKRDEWKINDRLKADYNYLEFLGYEVVAVVLQGSQNYDLDYEDSDIDTKALVLPSVDDIILGGKKVSLTKVLETNEHIDIKDIRLMFDNFLKQNINFLEILFSKYSYVNPIYKEYMDILINNREEIAAYDNYRGLNCAVGMSFQKYKALEHPYPSIKDKIDEYGYDGKQLHHMIRLDEFIHRYFEKGQTFEECLISKDPHYLISVKKNEEYSLKEAQEIAEVVNRKTVARKEKYMRENPQTKKEEVPILLENLIKTLFKDYLKYQL